MKDSIKVIIEAAKETPRLYFAPIIAAFHAVGKVEDAMVRTQRESTRGEFGNFSAKGKRQKK